MPKEPSARNAIENGRSRYLAGLAGKRFTGAFTATVKNRGGIVSKIEEAFERYENLLQEKEERILELQEEIEKLGGWSTINWSRPRRTEALSLPVPRLQIVLTIVDDWHYNWFYSLVYRHTTGDVTSVPMGETDSKGSHRHFKVESAEDACRELPFRDGVHIRKDAHQLNLPAFAIVHGKAYPLEAIK